MAEQDGTGHKRRRSGGTPHSLDRLWPRVAEVMACWTTDTELRFRSMDGGAFAQATKGAAVADILGKSIPELLGPRHGAAIVARVVAAYRAALAGDTVGMDYPAVLGGRWRIHLEPLRTDDGEICGVLGIGLFDAADGTPDDVRPRQVAARRRGVDVTGREWEVLERLRRGATTRDISAQLWITPATVRSHIASLCRKLGVTGRADLLRVLEPAAVVDESSTTQARAPTLR